MRIVSRIRSAGRCGSVTVSLSSSPGCRRNPRSRRSSDATREAGTDPDGSEGHCLPVQATATRAECGRREAEIVRSWVIVEPQRQLIANRVLADEVLEPAGAQRPVEVQLVFGQLHGRLQARLRGTHRRALRRA